MRLPKLFLWFWLFGAVSAPSVVYGIDELPALDPAVAKQINYRKDVWPIVKRHCWGCHSGANPKGGLNMDTVATMRTGGESGPLFKPGSPDESLLLEMTIGDEPEMPKEQPPLSVEKIQILRGWVLAGAKDDSTSSDRQPLIHIPKKYRFAPAITSVSFTATGHCLPLPVEVKSS